MVLFSLLPLSSTCTAFQTDQSVNGINHFEELFSKILQTFKSIFENSVLNFAGIQKTGM